VQDARYRVPGVQNEVRHARYSLRNSVLCSGYSKRDTVVWP
jgi:hypothetical protein